MNRIKRALMIADEQTQIKRTELCHTCPAMSITILGSVCGTLLNPVTEKGKETCGCLLAAKLKLKYQKCPRRKW